MVEEKQVPAPPTVLGTWMALRTHSFIHLSLLLLHHAFDMRLEGCERSLEPSPPCGELPVTVGDPGQWPNPSWI